MLTGSPPCCRVVGALCVLLGCLISGTFGAPPVRNVDELADRLEQLRREVKIPAFSVAIAKDDSIVWAKGFGMANLERQVPATPTTSYHLASLTKTFGSTIIMQLVEAGKIDLDAPVSKYGVELPGDAVVLVKHLMSHTSEGVPGARYRYNGDRYSLLSRVIDKTAGQSFGELVCARIIEPLGLNNTAPNNRDEAAFRLAKRDAAAFEANLAKGYELGKAGQFQPVEYPNHFSCSAGLIGSAIDVARFSIALDHGKLLSQASLDKAYTPGLSADGHKLPYGLGWFVTERDNVKLIWHYGLWIGNSSLIIKVPERKLTFVILSNCNRLTAPYLHGHGVLLVSPFAKAFVEGFVDNQGDLTSKAK